MGMMRQREYRWWLVSDTAGMAGGAIQQFALPLVAFALTRSTVAAGALGTVWQAVTVATALPGGVIVDRHDRRRVIRGYALGAAAVWAAVAGLAAGRWITYATLVGLVVVGAALSGLFGQATNAALRSIVPIEQFPSAVAINQGRDASIQLAAGPLGAALLGVARWAPFAAAAGAFALMWAAAGRLRADLVPPAYERRSIAGDIATAWSWVRSKPRLRVLGPIIAGVNMALAGVFVAVDLSLVRRGYTPTDIGLLSVAAAGSLLVGSVLAGWLVKRAPTGPLTVVTMLWISLALIPMVLTGSFAVAIACTATCALLVPSVNAGIVGYLFGHTPPELQGRLQSTMALVSGGLAALSPLLAGVLLRAAGHGWTVGVFAALMGLFAVVAAASGRVRGIPAPAQWAEVPL